MERSLKGKTLFITGGSRGIGEAIAIRAARDGAKVVIAAKTATPHPKLAGTIYTAAEAVEAAGGQALPLVRPRPLCRCCMEKGSCYHPLRNSMQVISNI